MDVRKLQRLNKEFSQKAIDAEVEVKKLRDEASTINEIIEAFRVRLN